MGFVIGSSCFLQPSLTHSPFSSYSSRSIFISSSRNADTNRSTVPMASFSPENSNNENSCQRRTIIFLGFSVLPLLQLRARALEGLTTSKLNVLHMIRIYKFCEIGFFDYPYDRNFGGKTFLGLLQFVHCCLNSY